MVDPYKSIHLIARELEARGFNAKPLSKDGKKYLEFTKGDIRWRSRTAYVDYPFVMQSLKLLSTHKDRAYDYVAEHGVAIAKTITVTSSSQIVWEDVSTISPLIVKPVDRGGSKGLTRNVTSNDELQTAIQNALTFSSQVLVQQQFEGQELRFTCINGRVQSAVLRSPASIKGDGKRSVEQLLKAENEARTKLNALLEYIQYPMLEGNLITRPLNLHDIVQQELVVQVAESTMISGGASVFDVLSDVDQSYLDIVENLVRSLDAQFLVVDILIADITKPANNENYIFLEFNTAPALKLYYGVRDGEQFDIVPLVTDMIVQRLQA
ncbi:MAG: hypothetical protein ABIR37_00255 [Candidatus Saccharimonadales bacterium]